jgi:hypothetical protein
MYPMSPPIKRPMEDENTSVISIFLYSLPRFDGLQRKYSNRRRIINKEHKETEDIA